MYQIGKISAEKITVLKKPTEKFHQAYGLSAFFIQRSSAGKMKYFD